MDARSQNLKILGLGRQIVQIYFGAFGVFLANLSAPILVSTVCPLPISSMNQRLHLQIYQNPNIYLRLGFEFGSPRIRTLAIVCP